MRVLVAEDDRGLREVLARGLRENGYVVDAVADGKAAMQFLRSYEYAIAVLDWRMPDVTGIEVLQWMRRRESHCRSFSSCWRSPWHCGAQRISW